MSTGQRQHLDAYLLKPTAFWSSWLSKTPSLHPSSASCTPSWFFGHDGIQFPHDHCASGGGSFAIIREKSIDIVPESLRPNLFDLLFRPSTSSVRRSTTLKTGSPFTDDIDTLYKKLIALSHKFAGGIRPRPMHRRSHLPLPAPSLWAPDLFDEGCMENLRAFMLVTSIKDICAEEEFSYYPADVEHDASTAAQIIESGFRLSFAKASDRANAIHVVTDMRFVRTYQVIDESPEKGRASAGPGNRPPAGSRRAKRAPAQPKPQPKPVKATFPAPAPAAPPASKAENTVHHKESLISVNLSRLDHLAAVVGEIVTESMVTASLI